MNERLARSADAMRLSYPQLTFVTESVAGLKAGVWRGVIRPIQSLEPLGEILDDIAHGRVVRVVGGEVRHHPDCREQHHRQSWMDRVVAWRIQFHLKVRWDGGNADPRCWIVAPPVWTPERKKHIWGDGSICPFMSSEAWDADRDDVVDFMAHVSVWLVKWMLWDQTDMWMGPEHAFSPEHHVASLQPTDCCWCRSGREYARCHLAVDRTEVASRRAQIAEVLELSKMRRVIDAA